MRGVDVLDQGDLVAGRGALAGDDGRVGEEVFPDLERRCQYVRHKYLEMGMGDDN